MKPRVYVETSIPSFYHETRPEPEMVAQRIWTRQWWDGRRDDKRINTLLGLFVPMLVTPLEIPAERANHKR